MKPAMNVLWSGGSVALTDGPFRETALHLEEGA